MCECPKCGSDLSAAVDKKCKDTHIMPTIATFRGSITTEPATVVVYCSNGHDAIAIECECR